MSESTVGEAVEAAPTDCRTIRLLMAEVYEPSSAFPLFVTSDFTYAREQMEPGDVLVKRWWVAEGRAEA